jgi:hypothetical protein
MAKLIKFCNHVDRDNFHIVRNSVDGSRIVIEDRNLILRFANAPLCWTEMTIEEQLKKYNDVILEGILFTREQYEENYKRGMINLVIQEAKLQQGEL